MARLIDRSFDPNRPVKVRRFFVAAGRHWRPGSLFPWQKLAIAQRRVKLLFDAGKLMHAEDQAPTYPQTPAPTIKHELEDFDILTAAATPVTEDAPEQEAETPEPTDELDDLNMKELRAIADEEGAPTRVSREAQREAIREHRRGNQ